MTDHSTDPILDSLTLNELADVMEDDMDELLSAFMEDAPQLVDAIANSPDNSDEARRAAHSLKSSSGTLGLTRLSAIARDLETGTGDRGQLIGEVRVTLAHSIEALQSALSP